MASRRTVGFARGRRARDWCSNHVERECAAASVAGIMAFGSGVLISTQARAAAIACTSAEAQLEEVHRATTIAHNRSQLERALSGRGIAFQPSATSFVLAQLGRDLHQQLRSHSVAVRRADTFEVLDEIWARIAVRDSETLAHLTTALDALRNINSEKDPHA